jgi:ATP-dependent RNA helicase DDX42
VLTLHGDKHQSDRVAAVRDFTKGSVKILIATDVAARGLDIPNVQTVLSFDHAKDIDSHVHRSGRAGRLSKDSNEQLSGSAYTLLTESNADFASVLLNSLKREGRAISPELEMLALGFVDESHASNTSSVNGGATSHVIGSFPLPVYPNAPLSKRARWD